MHDMYRRLLEAKGRPEHGYQKDIKMGWHGRGHAAVVNKMICLEPGVVKLGKVAGKRPAAPFSMELSLSCCGGWLDILQGCRCCQGLLAVQS